MPQDNPSVITAGELNKAPAGSGLPSPADIQFQHFSTAQVAAGASQGAIGVGRRTVPDPQTQFTSTALSGGQFGSGHAKSLYGEEE